jgi:hypothetical protein
VKQHAAPQPPRGGSASSSGSNGSLSRLAQHLSWVPAPPSPESPSIRATRAASNTEGGLETLEELHVSMRMQCFQWRRANLLYAHAFASALQALSAFDRAAPVHRSGPAFRNASRVRGRVGRAADADANARDHLWVVRTARGGYAAGPKVHRMVQAVRQVRCGAGRR